MGGTLVKPLIFCNFVIVQRYFVATSQQKTCNRDGRPSYTPLVRRPLRVGRGSHGLSPGWDVASEEAVKMSIPRDGWAELRDVSTSSGDCSLAIVAGGAAGSLGILFAGGGAAQAAVRSHDAHLRIQSFRQRLPRVCHPGQRACANSQGLRFFPTVCSRCGGCDECWR